MAPAFAGLSFAPASSAARDKTGSCFDDCLGDDSKNLAEWTRGNILDCIDFPPTSSGGVWSAAGGSSWEHQAEPRPSGRVYFAQAMPSLTVGVLLGRGSLSSEALDLLDFFCKDRDCLKQITDDPIVGNIKNRCFRIFVNSHDRSRVFHADEMLDSA